MANGPAQTQQIDLRQELLRTRSEIIRGLVQLAGAEPVRVQAGKGPVPAPTLEERLERLRIALPILRAALKQSHSTLAQLPPGRVPVPSGKEYDREELLATVAAAALTLDQLTEELNRSVTLGRADKIPEEAVCAGRENHQRVVPRPDHLRGGPRDRRPVPEPDGANRRVPGLRHVGLPAALPLGRFSARRDRRGVPARARPRPAARLRLRRDLLGRRPPRPRRRQTHPRGTPEVGQDTRRAATAHARLDPGARSRPRDAGLKDEHVEVLLEEVIQGVTVADRVALLADKAGLFKFDLKKLLNDYVNDVQVVTEFEDVPRAAPGDLRGRPGEVHRYFYNSDLYIVAHSEGTVVSFMGLLKGPLERGDSQHLRDGAAWVTRVRGYMTIGSPLNKHVFFWPELFDRYEAPRRTPRPAVPADPLEELLRLRGPDRLRPWPGRANWMERQGEKDPAEGGPAVGPVLRLRARRRLRVHPLLLPGAAHNDYWNDPHVFGHFLQNVVEADHPGVLVRRRGRDFKEKPGTIGPGLGDELDPPLRPGIGAAVPGLLRPVQGREGLARPDPSAVRGPARRPQ